MHSDVIIAAQKDCGLDKDLMKVRLGNRFSHSSTDSKNDLTDVILLLLLLKQNLSVRVPLADAS